MPKAGLRRLRSLLVYQWDEQRTPPPSLSFHPFIYQMKRRAAAVVPRLLTSSNQRGPLPDTSFTGLTCLLTKSTVKLYSQLPLPSRSPSISCVRFIRALGERRKKKKNAPPPLGTEAQRVCPSANERNSSALSQTLQSSVLLCTPACVGHTHEMLKLLHFGFMAASNDCFVVDYFLDLIAWFI